MASAQCWTNECNNWSPKAGRREARHPKMKHEKQNACGFHDVFTGRLCYPSKNGYQRWRRIRFTGVGTTTWTIWAWGCGDIHQELCKARRHCYICALNLSLELNVLSPRRLHTILTILRKRMRCEEYYYLINDTASYTANSGVAHNSPARPSGMRSFHRIIVSPVSTCSFGRLPYPVGAATGRGFQTSSQAQMR